MHHLPWVVVGIMKAGRHLEKYSTLCYVDPHCRYYLAGEQTDAEHIVLDL